MLKSGGSGQIGLGVSGSSPLKCLVKDIISRIFSFQALPSKSSGLKVNDRSCSTAASVRHERLEHQFRDMGKILTPSK